MTGKIRKVFLILAVSILMLAVLTVPAGAATRKLKNQIFTRSRVKAEAMASAVKTGSTTVVIPSKGRGFLKFTAPRTGKFSFTLSGLTAKKKTIKIVKADGTVKKKKLKQFSNGYFYVMQTDNSNEDRIGQAQLLTKGGRTNALWLATKTVKTGNKVGWRLKTRTGKIELSKGEKVYLYFNFNKGDRLKLKITA